MGLENSDASVFIFIVSLLYDFVEKDFLDRMLLVLLIESYLYSSL